MTDQTTELTNYLESYFNAGDGDLEKLSALFQTVTIEKDGFLSRIGDRSCALSIISEGHVRMYAYHNGKEVTQWIASPGEFVTDLQCLVFGAECRFEMQAIGRVKLHSMKHDAYTNIKNVLEKWYEIERLFLAKCFIILENRVTSFLAFSAEERYHLFYEQKRELFNQVPLNQLASMLGMTPETLSRIRAKSIS